MASRVGAPINVTFGASFTVPSGANAFIASGIWYDGANQAVTNVSGSRITTDNVAAVASSGAMGVYSVRGRVNSTGSDTWSITKAGFFSEGPTCQVQFYSVADNTNFVRQQQVVGDTSGAISRSVTSTTSDLVDAWIMSDGGGTVSGAISGYTAVGTEQTVNADKSRVFQANSPGASSTSITGPANSYPGLVIASVYDSSASPTNYTLTCDVGAYTLTGVAAALRRGYTLTANTGNYAITGQAATTKRGYSLTADVGSYSLTGQAATFPRDYSLTADCGSYSLTGEDATLTFSAGSTAYSLVCDVGAYSLTGQDATLTYTPGAANYSLTCDTGAYSLSGVDAGLNYGRRLVLDTGAYSLTGQAAGVIYGRRLVADTGVYSLTGQDATLTAVISGPIAYSLPCETGNYSLVGIDADLTFVEVDDVVLLGGGPGLPRKKKKRVVRTELDKDSYLYRLLSPEQREVVTPEVAEVIEAQAVEEVEQPKKPAQAKKALRSALKDEGLAYREAYREVLTLIVQEKRRQQAEDDEEEEALAVALMSIL